MSYDRLRDDREPRTVRDHTDAWNKLPPIGEVNGDAHADVAAFCERKRITVDALAQLGARHAVRREMRCLAFSGANGNGKVTAIKYRPLHGSSHDSFAENPSVWLRPIIVGDRLSLDWVIAEGETDAARLVDLVGDECAILVLPAGAKAFRREWADVIPRGATVALCHDADDDGDAGAEKAARIIGGRTRRVRPPVDGGDWCDWDGDQAAFLELAGTVRAADRWQFSTYADFAARGFPAADPLLGDPNKVFLAVGTLLMVYGADGSAKSTWTIDGIVHLAAGVPWLGIRVPRPVRFLLIENEGPPSLFQQKLRDKIESWDGPDPRPNIHIYRGPWGEFSFADPDARRALTDYGDRHKIDVVAANPTLGLGVGTSGKPDETQQFVDWLTECGLKTTRAFWLLHHENKAGQISGDWGRHPDTKVSLQRDGNKQRTKLDWNKTRWATLEPGEKVVMLEWVLEGQGYTVTELDTGTVGESDYDERIREYLTAHPGATTAAVKLGVKGGRDRIVPRLNDGPSDFVKGPRGAKYWFNENDLCTDLCSQVEEQDGNPYE
jgi:hypothetical protein